MPFPNFEGKHAHDSVFTASDFLDRLRVHAGPGDVPAPRGAVLLYQRAAVRHLLGDAPVSAIEFELIGSVSILERGGARAAVAHGFGIGAPAAAAVAECLIAWGVTRIVSVGLAGGLQNESRIGDVIVCAEAIRDEGTSHHYVPSARSATPSPSLTRDLSAELTARGITHRSGTSWTVDALFRETVAEARHYRDNGVLSVEMEAAALFAVGAYHGVDVAAAFVLSDSLAEQEWTTGFSGPDARERLGALGDAALACVLRG